MSTTYGKASWPLPGLTDPPNVPQWMQSIATQLDNFVIPKYASAAAQSAANPAPADGDKWYRTDLSQGFVTRAGVQLPDADSFGFIAETTLATAAASITFATIPTTFKHLRLVFQGAAETASTETDLYVQFNGSTSGYGCAHVTLAASSSVTSQIQGAQSQALAGAIWANSTTAWTVPGTTLIDIPMYSGTTFYKHGLVQSYAHDSGSIAWWVKNGGFAWQSTAAITSIKLFNAAGVNFSPQTFAGLYGYGS